MEDKKKEALENFLPEEDDKKRGKNVKKVVLDEREGIIERVDKILVTKDGKQLLREQY
jgi:hypothetical protein